MIPQNLLLAFLSLQGQEQVLSQTPASAQVDVNILEPSTSSVNYHDVNGFHAVEPVRASHLDQQAFTEIEGVKIHSLPFDDFPIGHYGPDGIVYTDEESGTVQVTTNTTSYLWSLPDSFPPINPYHHNSKVQGSYPQPSGFSVNFQKNWKEVHISLGVLSDFKFKSVTLKVVYRANRENHEETLELQRGGWTTWIGKAPSGSAGQGIDHVNFFFTATPYYDSVPRLIIESVTWS